jgi:hypothetical protein
VLIRICINFSFKILRQSEGIVLPEHSQISIAVTTALNTSMNGVYEEEIELVFADLTAKETFSLIRTARVNVGSKRDHELLQATSPFKRKKRVWKKYTEPLGFELRPPKWSETEWKTFLRKYPIPKAISDALDAAQGDPDSGALSKIFNKASGALSMGTYAKDCHTWLYVEEVEQRSGLTACSHYQRTQRQHRKQLEDLQLAAVPIRAHNTRYR